MYILSNKTNFKVADDHIIWDYTGEKIKIMSWGEGALRVIGTRNTKFVEARWELEQVEATKLDIEETEDGYLIKNGNISCFINTAGMLTFYNKSGEEMLTEYWNDGEGRLVPLRRAREYNHVGGNMFKHRLCFRSPKDEHIYGMGQYPNDCLDLKYTTLDLRQMNTHTTIPFALSSKGYGFIWNNPAIGQVEFAKNATVWTADECEETDYIIFCEDTPYEIISKYTELTGRCSVMPEYASGFWQSKLRYKTQEEFVAVAKAFKKRNIPVSVMVIDFFHWPHQGDFCFEESRWPKPEDIITELEEMGIKVVVSIWPTVEPDSVNYLEMSSRDYLLRAERGVQALFMMSGTLTYFDATNPDARKFVWNTIKKNYFDKGYRMFWLDQAEPEIRPYEPANTRYHLGNGMQVANVYPNCYLKTFYDGQHVAGQTDVINLVRSGWLGCQKYDSVLWSGDTVSTFDLFRRQIKVGLNASVAGVAWWTSDIGGFNKGDPREEWFRELFVRWFQFGAFCSVFRNHGNREPREETIDGIMGSGGPNEPWSYGEAVEKIVVNFIHIRDKLRPYIMEYMKEASKTGVSIMRPLFVEFPNDEKAYLPEDQYMFGREILVAPVTYENMTQREVYLPKGCDWVEDYTGKEYNGGQTIIADAPIEIMPIFTRKGSDIKIY